MSAALSANNSAVIGISIESVDNVDRQLASLAGRDLSSARQTSHSADSSLALVKAGTSDDPQTHAAMALALAPRIGEQIVARLSPNFHR
jgi:hypothetical protein